MTDPSLTFAYAPSLHGQVHFAQAGRGEPLLLLPGSARSYRQFLPLFPLLAPHFRVIAVDTYGYGASAPFPVGGSIGTLAEGVVAVLDALGLDKAHVFGIHTGHKVAAALAAQWPHRVGKVILAGKSHSIIPDQGARNDFILSRLRSRTHLREVGPEAASPSLDGWARAFRSVSAFWWSDAVTDPRVSTATLEAARMKVIDEIVSLPCTGPIYHANFAFDFTAAVARIQAPCLILEITHAGEDASIGRQGAKLAQHLPGAQVAELASVDESGFHCNADSGALVHCVRGFIVRPS